MVKKMNKTMFIKKIMEEANLSENESTLVNSILEDNFFLSKSNKPIIISKIEEAINVDSDRALEIYNIAINIIKTSIKNRLIHPFKNLNK